MLNWTGTPTVEPVEGFIFFLGTGTEQESNKSIFIAF